MCCLIKCLDSMGINHHHHHRHLHHRRHWSMKKIGVVQCGEGSLAWLPTFLSRGIASGFILKMIMMRIMGMMIEIMMSWAVIYAKWYFQPVAILAKFQSCGKWPIFVPSRRIKINWGVPALGDISHNVVQWSVFGRSYKCIGAESGIRINPWPCWWHELCLVRTARSRHYGVSVNWNTNAMCKIHCWRVDCTAGVEI